MLVVIDEISGDIGVLAALITRVTHYPASRDSGFVFDGSNALEGDRMHALPLWRESGARRIA